MNDIRNKEITINVKPEEGTYEAVARYMKRKGFKEIMKTVKAGLVIQTFCNDDYELWVGSSNYNDATEKITFTLTGNR